MNHRERMTAVLWGKKVPDKVPHGDLMIWPELIDALLGGQTFGERKNYLHFWMSETMDDRFFERDKRAREMLGFDYTHVFPSENWREIGKTSEGMTIMEDPFHVQHLLTEESVTMYKSPIADLTGIADYNLPAVDDFSFANLERWVNQSDLFTFLQIDSGIFKLYTIIGFEKFMLAAVDHKQNILSFMERLTDFHIELARESVARGADGIWLSDDHAGVDAPFLSPDMLWEMDFKFQKRIVDEIHRLGKPCVMHACGNLNRTIEGMIATGVDGIMGFQPTANNDISEYKRRYGDRIAIIGNICITKLMPHGTPWEIDQEVKKLVEEIGYNGGFVLSTCNSLLKDEPIANVLAMHLAVEKYGHYLFKDTNEEHRS